MVRRSDSPPIGGIQFLIPEMKLGVMHQTQAGILMGEELDEMQSWPERDNAAVGLMICTDMGR